MWLLLLLLKPRRGETIDTDVREAFHTSCGSVHGSQNRVSVLVNFRLHDRVLRHRGHAVHARSGEGDLGRWAVEAVHWALQVLTVEEGEVLDRLLALAQHVDDVFCEAAADESSGGDDLGADVLQEGAQEFRLQSFGWELEFSGLGGSEGGEVCEILGCVVWEARVSALEVEEGAQAGEEGGDVLQLAAVGENFGRERGGVAEDEGAVGFAFGDDFGRFAVGFLFRGGREDGASDGFGGEVGGYVGLFALDDEVVLYQIGENAAVGAVDAGGVEWSASKTGGGVDDAKDVEVVVAGDDNGVGRIVGLVFGQKFREVATRADVHARVEFLDAWDGRFGALLKALVMKGGLASTASTHRFANIFIAKEIARTEVLFGDGFIVNNREGADTRKSQVLCDLSAESAKRD